VVVAFFEQRLKEVAQLTAAQQVAPHSTHSTRPSPVTRRLQDCPSPHYLSSLLHLTFNSAHNHSPPTCTRTSHHAPRTTLAGRMDRRQTRSSTTQLFLRPGLKG
jgi:hypothetical protein